MAGSGGLRDATTGAARHAPEPAGGGRRVTGQGGFLGRKGDGEPGIQTVWLGRQRLHDPAVLYQVLRPAARPTPTVFSNRTYG